MSDRPFHDVKQLHEPSDITIQFKTCNNLFVCTRGDTIQYHGSLRSRELGQAPMLQVFLTPRQALSSQPRQQMVLLYWLQDRDSLLNWYAINHPSHFTHNEIQ